MKFHDLNPQGQVASAIINSTWNELVRAVRGFKGGKLLNMALDKLLLENTLPCFVHQLTPMLKYVTL